MYRATLEENPEARAKRLTVSTHEDLAWTRFDDIFLCEAALTGPTSEEVALEARPTGLEGPGTTPSTSKKVQ